MRVTKFVNEAIYARVSDFVNEKYKNEIEELERKTEERINKREELIEKFIKKAEKEIEELLNTNGFKISEYGYVSNKILEVYRHRIEDENNFEETLRTLRTKINSEIKQRVNSIIIALECGASKTEYEEIIQEYLK